MTTNEAKRSINRKRQHQAPADDEGNAFVLRNRTASSGNYLYSLYSSEQLHDVSVVVEGKAFHCHRIVLAAASNYFRAMFTGGMCEVQALNVDLTSMFPSSLSSSEKKEMMALIIEYVYKGQVQVPRSISSLCMLAALADLFGLDALTTECCDALSSNITKDNAPQLLLMCASLPPQQCTVLLAKVIKTIVHCGIEAFTPEFWQSIDWDTFKTIFQHDELVVHNEVEVLKMACSWLSAHPSDDPSIIEETFKLVRFPCISLNDVVGTLKNYTTISQAALQVALGQFMDNRDTPAHTAADNTRPRLQPLQWVQACHVSAFTTPVSVVKLRDKEIVSCSSESVRIFSKYLEEIEVKDLEPVKPKVIDMCCVGPWVVLAHAECASDDISVYNEHGRLCRTLTHNSVSSLACRFKNQLVSVGTRGNIKVWDSATDWKCQWHVCLEGPISKLIVHDKSMFAVYSNSINVVWISGPPKWEVLGVLEAVSPISSIAICHSDLILGHADGVLSIWQYTLTQDDTNHVRVTRLIRTDRLIIKALDTAGHDSNDEKCSSDEGPNERECVESDIVDVSSRKPLESGGHGWVCGRVVRAHSEPVLQICVRGNEVLTNTGRNIKMYDGSDWSCKKKIKGDDGGMVMGVGYDGVVVGKRNGEIIVWK